MAGVAAALPLLASQLPRQIYTFWHDRSNVPEFVLACIASIRHHNPDWTLHLLFPDDDDAPPPPGEQELTIQQLSDWRRLAALGRPGGGGVWIDASILVLRPLNTWINTSSSSLVGFAAPFDSAMESWAFAAPRDNPVVREWLNVFTRALSMGVDRYCDSLPDWMVGSMRHKGFLPYLAVCAAFVEVVPTLIAQTAAPRAFPFSPSSSLLRYLPPQPSLLSHSKLVSVGTTKSP
ncbi:MAG: hypothetical protein SGPRY_005272 [Prymnesium sp.]